MVGTLTSASPNPSERLAERAKRLAPLRCGALVVQPINKPNTMLFKINAEDFVATSSDSKLSHFHTDGFVNFASDDIESGVSYTHVEQFVKLYVPSSQEPDKIAARLMNHLILCHNR